MKSKKGVATLLKRYKAVLATHDPVDDETDTGDGYWFYLKPGLRSPSDETSFVHEYTLALCDKKLREVKRLWRKSIVLSLPH